MNKNVTITDGEAVSVISDPLAGETRYHEKGEPAREIKPLIMDKNFSDDDAMYDFRPQAVAADRPEANPKDLSAVEPADSSSLEAVQVNDLQLELDLTVPAAKVNGKPKP